ncbi:MAG: hypothetical protein IPN53_13415 [Comamonadaceae bacterium]|nr:hypothetical protein [Comamonadaceae bacterium]
MVSRVNQPGGIALDVSGVLTSGVASVGQAVAEMAQATQQNATLVEQMASAAGSLNAQAQDIGNSPKCAESDSLATGPCKTQSSRQASLQGCCSAGSAGSGCQRRRR